MAIISFFWPTIWVVTFLREFRHIVAWLFICSFICVSHVLSLALLMQFGWNLSEWFIWQLYSLTFKITLLSSRGALQVQVPPEDTFVYLHHSWALTRLLLSFYSNYILLMTSIHQNGLPRFFPICRFCICFYEPPFLPQLRHTPIYPAPISQVMWVIKNCETLPRLRGRGCRAAPLAQESNQTEERRRPGEEGEGWWDRDSQATYSKGDLWLLIHCVVQDVVVVDRSVCFKR